MLFLKGFWFEETCTPASEIHTEIDIAKIDTIEIHSKIDKAKIIIKMPPFTM